jgi:D-proline reductase (dithiol) PrdB
MTEPQISAGHAEDHVGAYSGFAQVTHDFLRAGYVADFDWTIFNEPSPRNRPRRPLRDATIGLISTAGAHLATQRPHRGGNDGDHTYRVIPADCEHVLLHHPGYDTKLARKDPGVVFPLGMLRHLVRDGTIGRLAPRVFAFMGYIPHTAPLLNETGPEVARSFISDQVDLALLVPA